MSLAFLRLVPTLPGRPLGQGRGMLGGGRHGAPERPSVPERHDVSGSACAERLTSVPRTRTAAPAGCSCSSPRCPAATGVACHLPRATGIWWATGPGLGPECAWLWHRCSEPSAVPAGAGGGPHHPHGSNCGGGTGRLGEPGPGEPRRPRPAAGPHPPGAARRNFHPTVSSGPGQMFCFSATFFYDLRGTLSPFWGKGRT